MDELIGIIQECADGWLSGEIGDRPPGGLVNRDTGLPPTDAEWQMIKARAASILTSPYASPGSVAWAMGICPDGVVVPFDREVKRVCR